MEVTLFLLVRAAFYPVFLNLNTISEQQNAHCKKARQHSTGLPYMERKTNEEITDISHVPQKNDTVCTPRITGVRVSHYV